MKLTAVFVSAALFAAALTGMYLGMRDLMINSGGACASGGPYTINSGQECSDGQVALLFGGVFVMLIGGGLLMAASSWYSEHMHGVGLLLWAALFGVLGWNFIDLGLDPPPNMSGAAGWIVSGVVFWLMALPALVLWAGTFIKMVKTEANPEAPENQMFAAPIVRANVDFVRNSPGDPAFGQTAPHRQDPAGGVDSPSVDKGFVDPVTGERHGGDE